MRRMTTSTAQGSGLKIPVAYSLSANTPFHLIGVIFHQARHCVYNSSCKKDLTSIVVMVVGVADGVCVIDGDIITVIVDVVLGKDDDVIVVRVVVACTIVVTEVGVGKTASEDVVDCTEKEGVVTSMEVGMSMSERTVVLISIITLSEDVVGTDSITDIVVVVCALDSSTANSNNKTHLHCLLIVDTLERSWSVWLQ